MDLKAPLRATLLFHRRTEDESPEERPLGAGLVVALGAVWGLCCCCWGWGAVQDAFLPDLWSVDVFSGAEEEKWIPIALRHRPRG